MVTDPKTNQRGGSGQDQLLYLNCKIQTNTHRDNNDKFINVICCCAIKG